MSMELTQEEAFQKLKRVSDEWHAIIPLLGAGVSVEAGIPHLGEITGYLAKVQYLARENDSRHDPKGTRPISVYSDHPDRYIQDFGWPDLHQLNSDLWYLVDPNEKLGPYRRRLRRIEEDEFLRDVQRLAGDFVNSFLNRKDKIPSLDIHGNWKSLLANLTRSSPDHVDTLFQRLFQGRRPGIAHRYLAFLAPLLGFRLFLTLNFDELLENALQMEGLHPTVYNVSFASPLPSLKLIRETLAIVKLHGGAFGLQVGERLDMPLDEDSKKRLGEYIPPNSLLLVMGLGGKDLRVLDLIELVAQQGSQVLWLAFDSLSNNASVKNLNKTYKPIHFTRVRHPGAFLTEFYGMMTRSNPVSRIPYRCLLPQPVVEEPEEKFKEKFKDGPPIVIFKDQLGETGFGSALDLARLVFIKMKDHKPIWIDLESMHTVADVVAEIFRQLRACDAFLPPVLLPDQPSFDSAAADTEEAWRRYDKAIRRIFDALMRGRYLLAFDAVSSFGRPPTHHHGHVKGEDEKDREARTKFLLTLFCAAHRSGEECSFDGKYGGKFFKGQKVWLRDSILAFAVDPERLEGEEGVPEEKFPEFLTVIEEESDLEKFDKERIFTIESSEAFTHSPTSFPTLAREILLLISAFRRRRSLAALHRLLPDYAFPKEDEKAETNIKKIEEVISQLTKGDAPLLHLEGGQYWMPRRLRNQIYDQASEDTATERLLEALDGKLGPDTARKQLTDLSELAAVHDRLADYYMDAFLASQEENELIEHLYHRIAGLRYLTKLDRVWDIHKLSPDKAVPKETRKRLLQPLPDKAPFNRISVRQLRLQRIRGLLRVLRDQEEMIRNQVPSATLLGWVDWVSENDLGRFLIEGCLEVPDDREKEEPTEKEISRVNGDLRNFLDALKCKVFLDSFHFTNCLNLQISWIKEKLGVSQPGGQPEKWEPNEIAAWLNVTVKTKIKMSPPEKGRRKELLRAVFDIWRCLRWTHRDPKEIDAAKNLAETLLNQEKKDEEELTEERVMWQRLAADQALANIGPWEMKGRKLEWYEKDMGQCDFALEHCKEGLEILDTATRPDIRSRSYFHSLRGRAHYLRKKFHEAHRELDLAAIGLPSQKPGDREMHAIRLLRLAECLMVRVDDVICREVNPQGKLRELSFEGKLCCALSKSTDHDSASSEDDAWLKRARKLRIALLVAEEKPRLLRVGDERLRQRLKNEGKQGKLEELEQQWTRERVSGYLESATEAGYSLCFETVARTLVAREADSCEASPPQPSTEPCEKSAAPGSGCAR